MAGASSIAFPSSDISSDIPGSLYPPPVVKSTAKPPHLPFRRISLPTPPSLIHRESVVSVASFDSLPEEGSSPASVSSLNQHHSQMNKNANTTSNLVTGAQQAKRTKRPSFVHRKGQPVGLGSRVVVDEAMEAKRSKVINEFYATERAYVDGLELIYSHFLTPIIASLDTPTPLLDRSIMTAVFSNFIDIWNLHRSFFSSLNSLLFRHNHVPESGDSTSEAPVPITSTVTLITNIPLSPLLLSHFPYLSLYTPFITSFPMTLSTLTTLITPPSSFSSSSASSKSGVEYNPQFAAFVKQQESDPRCGKLKLRDWLLTIVQRCPRYLLLLKDLISCTSPDDPERVQLENVRTLVAKITTSLNTSLQMHAQTLSLLALQRATPNLPFQLISPGRTLLKRGPLIQVERSEVPHEREFLLFSDCLVWLVREEDERAEKGEKVWGAIGGIAGNLGFWGGEKWGSRNNSRTSFSGTPDDSSKSPVLTTPTTPSNSRTTVPRRPSMVRSRSKSEAELTILQARAASAKMVAVVEAEVRAEVGAEPEPEPVPGVDVDGDNEVQPQSREKSNGTPPSEPTGNPLPSHVQKRRSFAGVASVLGGGGGGERVRTKSIIPRLNKIKRHASSVDDGLSGKEKWVFKGRAELVDLEVVVPVKVRRSRPSSANLGDGGEVPSFVEDDNGDDESERRWEVLSPEGSFVLYADTGNDRDEWTSQIRHAKAQLLVSLNVTHPNSTLTSSSSTHHLRRTLQALPFLPDDERLGAIDELGEMPNKSGKEKKAAKKKGGERRGRVEHWVPAIWIPDEKAEGCMRCGKSFGWRRRRHHCRLCGRCVCASCSERTFFISDPNAPSTDLSNNKPARACNACYETVFPLLDPRSDNDDDDHHDIDMTHEVTTTNGLGANFPSWLSMPTLPLSSFAAEPPSDQGERRRSQARDGDYDEQLSQSQTQQKVYDLDSDDDQPNRMMQRRVKAVLPHSNRPRSYHQILEDFASDQRKLEELVEEDDATTNTMANACRSTVETSGYLAVYGSPTKGLKREVSFAPSLAPSVASSKRHTVVHLDGASSTTTMLLGDGKRKEDTARRNKRFSMPAVALQTTSVTTRTQTGAGGASGESYDAPMSETVEMDVSMDSGGASMTTGVPSGVGASTLVFSESGHSGAIEDSGLPVRTRHKGSSSMVFGRNQHLHFIGVDSVGSKLKSHLHLKKDKGSGKINEEKEQDGGELSPPLSPTAALPSKAISSKHHDLGKGVAAGKLSELLTRKKSKLIG
ncbi:rho guanine nucleotide exchange factor [Moniliophthora roreri MCA 2997]|uniref:Rho guanine nucleotide exchange factor n=2 Tax=Moniliophthora roreri TaxID=221103 RepID=V2X232_MONRO|nr:rho guanine nucleotide exchange factor [Moniliophthora roreri MCA 2997]KAI3598543.1 rho guanine nucleotide exchange factor [Moniliophthora roreri]